MAEFHQVRKLRLEYDGETVATLPKTLTDLEAIVTPNATDSNINVPYLTYMYKGGPTEEKTIRVVSGEAELDFTHEIWHKIGAIPQKNPRHPNFATVFIITKRKSHPDLQPKPEPKKKKRQDYTSQECKDLKAELEEREKEKIK